MQPKRSYLRRGAFEEKLDRLMVEKGRNSCIGCTNLKIQGWPVLKCMGSVGTVINTKWKSRKYDIERIILEHRFPEIFRRALSCDEFDIETTLEG